MTNKKTQILAVTAVFVAVAMLVPSVSAASLVAEISGTPPTEIAPESGIGTLRIAYVYDLQNQLASGASLQKSSVGIGFTHTCTNSNVFISGPAVKLLEITPGGTSAQFTGDASFQVTANRQAPGLQLVSCTTTVSGDALQGAFPGTEKPSDAKVGYQVSIDYYGLVQAKIANKLQQAGPQKQVPFEIEVTNFGNARTEIQFEVGNAPSGKNWNALIPDNIILASPAVGDGKTTDVATFTVSTPYKTGWNNIEGGYQILLKPRAADEPDKIGSEISASVLVRVRGVYVPTLEPLFMIGALASAAIAVRRKSE